MKQLFSTLLCLIGLTAASLAQEPAKPAAEPKPAAKFTATDGYPADTCFVSGEALDDSAKVFTVDGHTFKTCCNKCKAKIEKDSKTFVAKKEEAITKAQGATYALTTCPISGKTLTDKAVSIVVDNTLVKLCCPNCKDKATADSATVVSKVQKAAFEKQAAHYTAKTCPVSGHDLDATAVPVMHGTTLVKLCCKDCMEKFTANANAMAAKVTAKTEAKPESKTDKKAEATGEKKSGHETPMAAPSGETGGAACCESGKAESGCCQAGEKKGAACCEATKKEAKTECCEAGQKAEAKTECCETGAKAEAKAKAEPAKKLN